MRTVGCAVCHHLPYMSQSSFILQIDSPRPYSPMVTAARLGRFGDDGYTEGRQGSRRASAPSRRTASPRSNLRRSPAVIRRPTDGVRPGRLLADLIKLIQDRRRHFSNSPTNAVLSRCGVRCVQHSLAFARRSHRPKPAFRKVIFDGDRRSDGRYLEISASSCAEGATLDWRWPPTYSSGPFALATPCTHVPGRYSGPSKFKSRVAHPWSWDIGSSTSAAWTSLNMVLSCRKARPFGLSTKLGLQESGRPSPKGTALWPEPCSMD